MFLKMEPQPGVGDFSQRKIERHGDKGLGIMDSPPNGGFIPFPEVDPTGVKIVSHNGLWYWARPRFSNPTLPIEQVRKTLQAFEELFSDRQMRLIANALNYADNDPAGLGGHQAHILISKLYTLVEILSEGYFDIVGSLPRLLPTWLAAYYFRLLFRRC